MPLRYTDLDTPRSPYKNFVIRRRRPTLREIFIICVGVIGFAAGITLSLSTNDKLALMSVLVTLGGCLCLYTITQIKRTRDLLQSTEVQNAMFASALNMDHAFSFITTGDGNMVYVSPGFKDLFKAFTESDSHDVKAWIEAAHLRPENAAAIVKAIEDGSKQELVCDLFTAQENRTRYHMLIAPIPRPEGFVLVRCREQS